MGHILQHAAEYETVRRLSDMLVSAKEEYKTTESYALFSTIVCWVMQRARTPADFDDPADRQAREVGIALQESPISEKPWLVDTVPNMTAFEFFIAVRIAVAHGDGRQIKPLNEHNILVGQLIPINGFEIKLYRADMQRLGCALADIFCSMMKTYEPEGLLLEAVDRIEPREEDV